MNAKIVQGKRIAQILRNDSEAAQWLAAMERAKKADKETEFNTEFQKLLDAEEKQQLSGRKTKSTAEIVGEMEPGEDYGYEGTEGIDFSRSAEAAKAAGAGITREQFVAQLTRVFNRATATKLVDSVIIQLLYTQADQPKHVVAH
jgi:hypothetical protein